MKLLEKTVLLSLGVSALAAIAPAAATTVLYSAGKDYDTGNCTWDTKCGTGFTVAQGFSLSNDVTITNITVPTFAHYEGKDKYSPSITSIAWAIYDVSGSGTPGTVLASGSSHASSTFSESRTSPSGFMHDDYYNTEFTVPFVSLDSGSYFIALTATSLLYTPTHRDYWATSSAVLGQTYELSPYSSSWEPWPTFAGNGFGVTLEGTVDAPPPPPPPPPSSPVPEPASWAMMIAGFGAVGAAMRRRKVSVRFG